MYFFYTSVLVSEGKKCVTGAQYILKAHARLIQRLLDQLPRLASSESSQYQYSLRPRYTGNQIRKSGGADRSHQPV